MALLKAVPPLSIQKKGFSVNPKPETLPDATYECRTAIAQHDKGASPVASESSAREISIAEAKRADPLLETFYYWVNSRP